MWRAFGALALVPLLAACSSMPTLPPVKTVPQVELPRFMGDWYVLGSIPTFIEKQAYNAVESYRLDPDGTIATTFTFRKGAFDGPKKRYTPKGFVRDSSNAVWGMQFVWPVKAEYLINYVNDDYTQTIIARSKRDYVWVLARSPRISDADYAALITRVRELGYDVSQLRRVPQEQRP